MRNTLRTLKVLKPAWIKALQRFRGLKLYMFYIRAPALPTIAPSGTACRPLTVDKTNRGCGRPPTLRAVPLRPPQASLILIRGLFPGVWGMPHEAKRNSPDFLPG